jgi:sigma-B regulation protein RsbU (phosphoserine phosphatase)
MRLRNTGIPLGIEHGMCWNVRETVIGPGALLLLYTDGISEAQNVRGELFAEERLLEAARLATPSAAAIQAALLGAVDDFVGAAPQYDDMTLMILAREVY